MAADRDRLRPTAVDMSAAAAMSMAPGRPSTIPPGFPQWVALGATEQRVPGAFIPGLHYGAAGGRAPSEPGPRPAGRLRMGRSAGPAPCSLAMRRS
jgi:hypothetical protein